MTKSESTSTQQNVPRYIEHAVKLGYYVSTGWADADYGIQPMPDWPITLKAVVSPGDPTYHSLWLYVRATSWHPWDGARFDLNDLFSLSQALHLRYLDLSPTVITVEHPATDEPAGVYARLLALERPNLAYFVEVDTMFAATKRVLLSLGLCVSTLVRALDLDAPPFDHNRMANDYGLGWGRRVSSVLKERFSARRPYLHHEMYERTQPSWRWFRTAKTGLSAFNFEEGYRLQFLAPRRKAEVVLEGPSKLVLGNKDVLYAVDRQRVRIATNLVNCAEPEAVPCDIVPIENGFFALGSHTMVFIDDDCGATSVDKEREAIRERQQKERDYLFPAVTYTWADRIVGDRFELLINELIAREPGVIYVRKVSSGSERDGGKDLIAEWIETKTHVSDDEPPYRIRRVLVQCKAHKRNVGPKEVTNIRDTIERNMADGYFLAVSAGLTTDLTDHLWLLRERADAWVRWWTRLEIEDRLRKNPDIGNRYPDIITARTTI